jgi:hypothetical protein
MQKLNFENVSSHNLAVADLKRKIKQLQREVLEQEKTLEELQAKSDPRQTQELIDELR